MPRPPRKISESGYYHITLRGNGKQLLFESDVDRHAFLDMLQRSFSKFQVKVVAWCLMGNHVHLVIYDGERNLSAAVGSLTISYAGWFNHRLGHVGHVFQERFGNSVIESEEYLLEAIRYVHNNPCKAGIVVNPAEYAWSSHRQYLGCTDRLSIVDAQLIAELFDNCDVYRKFMSEPSRVPYAPKVGARVSDEDALAIAKVLAENLAHCDPSELKRCDKKLRDRIVAAMRSEGLTVKQVQRITGLGDWVIKNVTTQN